MFLVYYGAKTEKITFLLHEGCNVNAVDKCGRTALHYVFTSEYEMNCEYIKVLIDAGADCLIKDEFHKTPFHYIVYKPREQQVQCLCYFFTHYRQLFHRLELKLQLNETIFLSRFNKITKQMTELLSTKNYESTESYFYEALHMLPEKMVSDILCTKGIGGIKDVPEFQLIQDQVDLVMGRLATQLSKDTQFNWKIQRSGSLSENCKVGLPDEFDYLFIIEGMERYFDMLTTQTPGFASVQKKNVEDFHEELCYFVNEDGYMVSACFLHYFSQKIFEILRRGNIWEGTKLYWWKSQYEDSGEVKPAAANFLLECRYHVPNFKDINCSIDVVAALPIPHDKSKEFFVDKQNLDSPELFVLPTKSYWSLNSLQDCRISTAVLETSIISSMPRYLTNAFMLLKILNEHKEHLQRIPIPYHYASTTYRIKTVLLNAASKIKETNRKIEQNSDDIKLTLEAARILVRQYSKFKEDENMPTYFFKTNLLEDFM